MTSLLLLFQSGGDKARSPRIDPLLKELCSYWLLLDGAARAHGDDIRRGLGDKPGEVLDLRTVPVGQRRTLLQTRLQGKPSHVLFLPLGAVVETDLAFQLPGAEEAVQVLHLSPRRDQGCWLTSLVPNSAEYWTVDPQGRFAAVQGQPARRNNHIHIIDAQRFRHRTTAPEVEIKELLQDNVDRSDPAIAIRIAEVLTALRDPEQALQWYRTVLNQNDSPALVWRAHYGAVQSLKQHNAAWGEIEAHLAAAFEADPDRVEPLFDLVEHYRRDGDYAKARDLAAVAYDIQEPGDGIVFDLGAYRHRLPFAYAQCCFALEHDSQCIDIINKTLRKAAIPESARRDLAALRARACERLYPVYPVSIARRNRLLLVVPFRNAGEFLHKCVTSIRQQDYADYRVVLIDDASDDGAMAKLGPLDKRFIAVVNEKSLGALCNQTAAIIRHAEADDIVVHLDGDDWLAHAGALSYINDFFNRTRCWIMYGQFESSLGTYGNCEPLTGEGEAVDTQLAAMHFPMHIRAYRAGVFFALREQDPGLAVLKDEHGSFLDAISDLALMQALIRIAGADNTRYNERILYVYNRNNPQSHHRSREAIALQRAQSRTVAEKPRIRRVGDYRSSALIKERRNLASNLVIALDAVTPQLLQQWAAERKLPNFARLLERCESREIAVPAGFGNDAFWTAVATGKLPDETGYFFRMRWDPDNYRVEFGPPAEQVDFDSFWTECGDGGSELAVIDFPEVKHGGRINGLEISEWLPHARVSGLETCPPELRDDVLTRFGGDPNKGSTERSAPRSASETVRDVGLLLQSIEQKTRGARHYLERGGWRLFAVGYQQAHDAGHQFWHLHDPSHPRYSKNWVTRHGDPLLKVYQAIDRGVGELAATAGDDVGLVMIAGLSMQAKKSCNSVLDQLLYELDAFDRRAAGQPVPGKGQLDQRRFFAIPHNNMSGAVRINLAGREARGTVRDGDDYKQTIALLKKGLMQLINCHNSQPVIDEIISLRDSYTGTRVGALPDLFLIWRRTDPITAVSAPWLQEPVSIRSRGMLDTRSGDHVGQASVYCSPGDLLTNGPKIDVRSLHRALVGLCAV